LIVRALCDVYVETAFREAGAVFEYHGKPNKHLQPVPASFRPSKAKAQDAGLPEPPTPGKLIEAAPPPEQLAVSGRRFAPPIEADDGRDLLG